MQYELKAAVCVNVCALNNVYKFIIMIIITFHFDGYTIEPKQRTIVFIVVAHLHDKTAQDVCIASSSSSSKDVSMHCKCLSVCVCVCKCL